MVRMGVWAAPCASPPAGGVPSVTEGGRERMGSTWVTPFSNEGTALRRDPRLAVQVARRAVRFWIRLILKRRNTATMNARRRITTMAAIAPPDRPDVLSPLPELARSEFVAEVISGSIIFPELEFPETEPLIRGAVELGAGRLVIETSDGDGDDGDDGMVTNELMTAGGMEVGTRLGIDDTFGTRTAAIDVETCTTAAGAGVSPTLETGTSSMTAGVYTGMPAVRTEGISSWSSSLI